METDFEAKLSSVIAKTSEEQAQKEKALEEAKAKALADI